MAISYGGITLALSTPELDLLQETYLKREQIVEFDGLYGAPADLGHLPFVQLPPPTVKNIGRLYWPRDASRYAFAHFAVSDRILALIRPLAYATSTLNALTLTMSDGTRTISTAMYMLPPRPISQILVPGVTGGNLWMLTLVDERYFWWMRAAEISVDEGVTTWVSLYGQIATGLDATLTVDTVNANYGMPTRRFTVANQPLPVMLDSIAYSVGQRVARQFDGTVLVQNYDAAKTIFDANYTSVTNRGFGGKFFTIGTGAASGDMFALVPEEVRVVFPLEVLSTGAIDETYAIDNPLTGLTLPEYPGAVAGFPGRQVLWGDQIAFASGVVITNLTDLEDYATQASEDWYKWQLGGCDVSYSGIGDWEPEAITDSIEIIYESNLLTTRVQRGTWNDRSGGGLFRQGGEGSIVTDGVRGQANSLPVPGEGPRGTINLIRAEPPVGDNLEISLNDNPGAGSLDWTIDNLGVFGRVGSGGTSGPRRRLNIDNATVGSPININNLDVTFADDPGNDELDWTIDNLGVFGRANEEAFSGMVDYGGPRRGIDLSKPGTPYTPAGPAAFPENVKITITDVPANDELLWEIDALGIFARAQSGTTHGARRRLNFMDYADPYYGTLLTWETLDDFSNDEIEVLPTINIQNISGAGPRDWHYWKNVSTNHRFYNHWPIEYAQLSGAEFGVTYDDGFMIAMPFLEVRGGTLDRIGVYVGTAAPYTDAVIRLGIYRAASVTSLVPDALVLDAGEVLVDDDGGPRGLVEITISQSLAPGYLYWLVARFNDSDNEGFYAGSTGTNIWAPFGVRAGTDEGFPPGNQVLGGNNAWDRAFGVRDMGPIDVLPDPFPDPGDPNYFTVNRDGNFPIIFVRYSG